jgi:hypothetical protein
MSQTRKPHRLAYTYTFPGFQPLAYVQGIFGDPQARLDVAKQLEVEPAILGRLRNDSFALSF